MRLQWLQWYSERRLLVFVEVGGQKLRRVIHYTCTFECILNSRNLPSATLLRVVHDDPCHNGVGPANRRRTTFMDTDGVLIMPPPESRRTRQTSTSFDGHPLDNPTRTKPDSSIIDSSSACHMGRSMALTHLHKWTTTAQWSMGSFYYGVSNCEVRLGEEIIAEWSVESIDSQPASQV